MSKKQPAPSDIADKFMLRLPEGMRDQIAEAAKENHRSMNSEIVARLEASLNMDMPIYQRTAGMVKAMDATVKFMQTLSDNLEKHPELLEAWEKKFGKNQPADTDEKKS